MPTPALMPSPPIPRTSTITRPQRRHHHVTILPSNRSTSSAPPCPNSTIFSRTLKKLTKLLQLRNNGSSTPASDLTEENLEEHNKRQAMTLENERCSPYYKGLTDQTLAIRIGRPNYRIIQDSLRSPGRESRATADTAHTSFTSLSGFVFNVKERGANKASGKKKASGTTATVTRTMTTTSSLKEMGTIMDQKKSSRSSVSKEKLLRERVSEEVQPTTADKPVPVLMPASSSISGLEPSSIAKVKTDPQNKEGNSKGFMKKDEKDADDKGLEREFVWATKYRPKALKDFICNRDEAMSLHGMV